MTEDSSQEHQLLLLLLTVARYWYWRHETSSGVHQRLTTRQQQLGQWWRLGDQRTTSRRCRWHHDEFLVSQTHQSVNSILSLTTWHHTVSRSRLLNGSQEPITRKAGRRHSPVVLSYSLVFWFSQDSSRNCTRTGFTTHRFLCFSFSLYLYFVAMCARLSWSSVRHLLSAH